MASRLVIFDVQSLLRLMTHYSCGEVPLAAEAKAFAVSARLPRWVSIIAESNEWQDTPLEQGDGYGGQAPLHFRYEGKRTMKIVDEAGTAQWSPEAYVEAPKQN